MNTGIYMLTPENKLKCIQIKECCGSNVKAYVSSNFLNESNFVIAASAKGAIFRLINHLNSKGWRRVNSNGRRYTHIHDSYIW